jgi:hypothetical protein
MIRRRERGGVAGGGAGTAAGGVVGVVFIGADDGLQWGPYVARPKKV